MPVHLQKEIEKLKKQIVLLAGSVEKRVADAVKSIDQRDAQLAQLIKDTDQIIDQTEIEVEEECLKILALYQPVAMDLRFIIAVLKINSDLERIGDEAVNIAGRSLNINAYPKIEINFDLKTLASNVMAMLKRSLDALVNMDASMAHSVIDSDDEIDETVRMLFQQVKDEVRHQPEKIDYVVEYMRINRHLERIADHATNIAEDIIYMIEGKIVRHNYEK
ncbi:MAG: phosphate signaling complex protein PhoU [Acidobacteria bacterium]|nr:phosphate signaling complex protein PhoU [Acidobacteriota bacterium]MBU4307385.1 phosphate signaling complex protein PhoU [Acidobacteriota bacterium]MCG2811624.1 phosphate signaling complex protein PhoU [Candidatus Aminicenantes bacterium]